MPRGKLRTNQGRQSSKRQYFSKKRCVDWFCEYTNPDEPDTLDPDGIKKLCADIGVEPEDIVMLVLAYKMDAKQMGFLSRCEWLKGLTELKCDSAAKLQSKLGYLRSIPDDPNAFKNMYKYAYAFAKDSNNRTMDIITAKAMLQVLLGKRWELYTHFTQFLDQSEYEAINKDQWRNILEFSLTISNDLTNYDINGSWPLMLDEFVEWLRQQRTS